MRNHKRETLAGAASADAIPTSFNHRGTIAGSRVLRPPSESAQGLPGHHVKAMPYDLYAEQACDGCGVQPALWPGALG
jgi:hypothetical protein